MPTSRRVASEALSAIALMALAAACGEATLRSLDPPVLLPDGSEFKTWEQPCEFTRTYYIDGASAAASDDNAGTSEKPWKTISKAAATLAPGERVLVAPGVYRERVRPARGGTSPAAKRSDDATAESSRANGLAGCCGTTAAQRHSVPGCHRHRFVTGRHRYVLTPRFALLDGRRIASAAPATPIPRPKPDRYRSRNNPPASDFALG